MKGYGWTIVMYSVGQPVAYLFAMGVGLATLVDTNTAAAFGGVSYLAFIAPALLISAAVMTAANEFTFPVMDGFKWRRVYYGPHASPLTPEQIAAGHIIAVHGAVRCCSPPSTSASWRCSALRRAAGAGSRSWWPRWPGCPSACR